MLVKEFATEAGVILQVKRPNRFDVLNVQQALYGKRPKPPNKKAQTAFGEEMIPDYEDIEYRIALSEWEVNRAVSLLDFFFLEYIEVEVPEDLAYIEETYRRMERYGATSPYDLTQADDRKLAYLRRLLTNEELLEVQRILLGMFGATEEEVAEAEATFPGEMDGAGADGRVGGGVPGGSAADPGEPGAGTD